MRTIEDMAADPDVTNILMAMEQVAEELQAAVDRENYKKVSKLRVEAKALRAQLEALRKP